MANWEKENLVRGQIGGIIWRIYDNKPEFLVISGAPGNPRYIGFFKMPCMIDQTETSQQTKEWFKKLFSNFTDFDIAEQNLDTSQVIVTGRNSHWIVTQVHTNTQNKWTFVNKTDLAWKELNEVESAISEGDEREAFALALLLLHLA